MLDRYHLQNRNWMLVCLFTLTQLYTYSTVVPEVMLPDLTKFISKTKDHPIAGGGFGDIWKCIYKTDGGRIDVSLRYLSTLFMS